MSWVESLRSPWCIQSTPCKARWPSTCPAQWMDNWMYHIRETHVWHGALIFLNDCKCIMNGLKKTSINASWMIKVEGVTSEKDTSKVTETDTMWHTCFNMDTCRTYTRLPSLSLSHTGVDYTSKNNRRVTLMQSLPSVNLINMLHTIYSAEQMQRKVTRWTHGHDETALQLRKHS